MTASDFTLLASSVLLRFAKMVPLADGLVALTAHILQMLEEFLYPHARVPLL